MALGFIHKIVQSGIVARANQATVADRGWWLIHDGAFEQRHDLVFAATIIAQRTQQWRPQALQGRTHRSEPFEGMAQRRQVSRVRRAAGDPPEQTLNVVNAA